MPKRFERKNKGTPAQTDEFTLVGERDGVEEEHEFNVRLNLQFGDLAALVAKTEDKKKAERSLPVLVRIIRRALLNNDGTPANWEPNIVDGHFTAPNGDHCPIEDLPEFEAFEAGSSRRRWTHLMDIDEDVSFELEQITAVFEWLVERSSGDERPTSQPQALPA